MTAVAFDWTHPSPPDGWKIARIADMATLVNGFPFASELFAPQGEVPLVRIRDVTASDFETYVPASDVPSKAWIKMNDLLVGMDGDFNTVLWKREPAAMNQRVCSLRPRPGNDIRFIAYMLPPLLKRINDLTYATTVKHLAAGDILSQRVARPELQQQQQIADYLDAQTATIDLLIEKQERLIETLAERLDGLWSSAVGRLIADFPSVPLRRVIDSIVDGPFGSSLTSAHYSDEGAAVVRLGNIGIDEFRLSDRAFIPLDYARSLVAHSVLPGDVVVAGLGDDKMPLGRAAIVPESFGSGIVKADCYRLRPSSRTSADYLAWILSSPQSRTQFQAMSRGSTRQRLNTQVVRDVVIPVPTLDVQREAVVEFASARQSNTLLVGKAREMIHVLKERRQALISAAVTGKIDVRGLS